METIARILPLTPELANQIAAGEVVERPASVLKELLENSIDAKATQIDICVEQGGIGLIRVQDNGQGICQEDLLLSLRQHATSKIQTLTDLEQLYSYGFRGEALASISAVSRFKIYSSVVDQKEGACLEWVSGKSTMLPCPPIQGTLVEVRDLFFNTPARRKFLRSARTEGLVLEETYKRIALSQTSIGFNFKSGLKTNKTLPACRNESAIVRRVAELCGQKFVERSKYLEVESNGLKLTGWLGSSEDARAQPDLQYFYVNGRIIRDKVVNHAIRSAYEEILPLGKYPAYVLFLELDPAMVDVNVHPTKHEVRFREARLIHAFIAYGVRKVISSTSISSVSDENKLDLFSNIVSQKSDLESNVNKTQNLVNKLVETQGSSGIMQAIRPLSMIQNKILLAEIPQGLLLAEVYALHQILLKQQFKETYPKSPLSSRPLLIPQTLDLGNKIALIENPKFEFQKLGFEWTQSGSTTLLLRAVPDVIQKLFRDFQIYFLRILEANEVEEILDLISSMATDSMEFNLQKSLSVFNEACCKLGVEARKYFRELSVLELHSVIQKGTF